MQSLHGQESQDVHAQTRVNVAMVNVGSSLGWG